MKGFTRLRPGTARGSPKSRDVQRPALPPLANNMNVTAALFASFSAADGSDRILSAVAPMTVKQFAAFLMIAFPSQAHTVGSLADNLGTTPPVITRTLDRLEGMRLVSRQRSTTDRRVVHLSLTRKGEELAQLINDVIEAGLTNITGGGAAQPT